MKKIIIAALVLLAATASGGAVAQQTTTDDYRDALRLMWGTLYRDGGETLKFELLVTLSFVVTE